MGREPRKAKGFRPDIQGLRAIAVGMVVIYHLCPSWVPGGFAGVDVFFVISGYLITGHLWGGYRMTGKVSLTDFWGRRVRRLVPAAALVLTVTWCVARLVLRGTPLRDTAQQVLASALYFQNWQLARDSVDYLKVGAAATPVQHFWSLSAEEQFYLVWPLLFLLAALVTWLAAWVAARSRPRRSAGPPGRGRCAVMGGLTVALVAGSLAYSAWYSRANPAAAYFVTTARMWEFGIGGLLAIAPARLSRPLGRQGWLAWAGLASVTASAFALSGAMAFPGYIALLPVLGAAALIAGGSAEARFGTSRLLSARPMVFTGGISYSLYLWHFAVISLFTTWYGNAPGPVTGPVIAVMSVLLAWLTKTFIEDAVRLAPIIARHRWRSVSTALFAVIPVALASAFMPARPAPWHGRLPAGYPGAAALAANARSASGVPVLPPPDALSQSSYRTAGCLVGLTVSTPRACVFGDVSRPVLTVALVGDSAAGEWFDALSVIAKKRHWKLVLELHSSCPWTATRLLNSNGKGESTACRAWGAAVLHDLLTTTRPNVVITSDYPSMGSVAHPSPGSPEAMADIAVGMAEYWTRLEKIGIPVTPVRESPDLAEDVPTCVEEHLSALGECDVPAATAIVKDPPVVRAARLMNGTVRVADLNSLICGPQACRPVVGNVLVFSDQHHLTWPYSQTTAPFAEAILLKVNKALAVSGRRPTAGRGSPGRRPGRAIPGF